MQVVPSLVDGCPSNYTHPFNGHFSGTIQVSRYQKGKTNLDFTEARDSEWQWHRLEHMQVCTSLQTDNSCPSNSTQKTDGCGVGHPSEHITAVVITADSRALLSPTLPTTTGPIYHQHQAGTQRSDVAACNYTTRSHGQYTGSDRCGTSNENPGYALVCPFSVIGDSTGVTRVFSPHRQKQ